MDAGVPIARPVAGIAMGLIKEGDDYIVLTDIAGVEDHLGDMDFKVAGTSKGVTALQMDIKIKGVTFDILRDALEQARRARLAILDAMTAVIDAPGHAVGLCATYRHRAHRSRQDRRHHRQGRRDQRGMEEEFDCTIEVEDDGLVKVFATDGRLGDAV